VLNRRNLLVGTVAGLGTSLSAAMGTENNRIRFARPYRPQSPRDLEAPEAEPRLHRTDLNEPEPAPRPHLVLSDELNGLSIDHFVNRPRPYPPRRFSTIRKIIEDIERSRVYLGLHWNFDCTRGAESGDCVAKAVYEPLYRRTRRSPEVSEYPERHRSG
jgi:hypothetical protein